MLRAVAHIGIVALTLAPLTSASAQRPRRDTARTTQLDTVVVTAERTSGSIASTAAAVTRISPAEIQRIPHATLADVLKTVPGFTVVDFDGLGFDPQLMTRGFYGGGEAEYVVVMLDGKPINQVHTGRAFWESLPTAAAIEAIEVVRGGSSALYGDAAIGGVINIITRGGSGAPSSGVRIAGGSHGTSHMSAGGSGVGGLSLSLGRDETEGYRVHSERSSSHARIWAAPYQSERGHFGVSYLNQSRRADEPGPVPESVLGVNRTFGDLLFQFDRLVDRNQEIGLDGSRRIGSLATLKWYANTEWRTTTNVRTVALAPGFGDTKHRDARLRRTLGSIQAHLADGLLPIPGEVVAGAEYGVGSVDSRYFLVASGDYDAYASASGGRGELDASADAGRSGGAAFIQYAARPMPRVRFTLGARYDWLDDSFDPVSPSGQTRSDVTHEAFSPKAGVNVRYLDRGTSTGNVYVTAGRSFKAPTLDQLFDVRNLPVPFPPFSIRSSNASLKPQTGTNLEAGIYHSATLSGGIAGSLTASIYQMDMQDEIDFDVATLSYGNIAESRHRGAEVGARIIGPGTVSTYVTYTLQAATAEAGDNAGNQLKAIPRHTLSAGAAFSPIDRVQTGINLTRVGEAFIDDANTRTLPAYTRVDARLGVRISAYEVFGEARNLFGARYNTTGFLDPSGSGTAYYYPAAERVLMIGIRTGATR